MDADAMSLCEAVAAQFRWIVAKSDPGHPRQNPRIIRMVVGQDDIDEKECAPDEQIVSVSESGIRLWFRPYSQPGVPRFDVRRIIGLSDFMLMVVWPRIVGDCCVDRLLHEVQPDRHEEEAIDEYRRLQIESRELTRRDIDNLLADKSHLKELYAAIRASDVETLRTYSAKLPEELGAIGAEDLRDLIAVIVDARGDQVASMKSYLIYRILQIAAEPLLVSGRFNWQSAEHGENIRKSLAQIQFVGRLARRRYAKGFLAFCLSDEVVEISCLLSKQAEGEARDAYRAAVSSFVEAKLVSAEFAGLHCEM